MNKFTIIAYLSLLTNLSNSQTFFNLIPNLGGDEMEGKIYNVIPLKDEIKIIGLIHDSIIPGFDGGTWPILGTMSYNGEYSSSTVLVDSAYSDGFDYFTRRLTFKNDSICFVYTGRDLGAQYFDACLIELNVKSGKILTSKIIYDEISGYNDFTPTDLTIGKNGNIYLVNFTGKPGNHPQILTVLDSNLTIKSQTFIPNYGRRNLTKYIEEDQDGNIVLIGFSLGEQNTVWYESKLFRQVLDENYNSINFKLAPTVRDQTIFAADYYPILKANTGEWIFASQVFVPTNDCFGCSIGVPYIVRVSSDFTNVLSETRLFDGNIKSSKPSYKVWSITEVSDGYILAGASDGMLGIETSGFLGKVSLDGDSLWLKHFIPVEWDTIQASWFHWQDIKTTPSDNIVIGGFASDRYTSRILPWILHLDKDGCLEPGCSTTAIRFDSGNKLGFNIYPNPATDETNIHLLATHSTLSNFKLNIFNALGISIKEIPLYGNNINLMLDIDHLSSGSYFIQLTDNMNSAVATKVLIIK